MSLDAAQVPRSREGEQRLGQVSFALMLGPDELLTGTPTVTEVATSDLTIANVARNSAAVTINGRTVPVDRAVRFLVSGHVPGRMYRLRVEAVTNSVPAQTLRGIVAFRAFPAV